MPPVIRDVNERPEKVVGRPADGESDGDSAEKTRYTTATGQHVGGATTAH